MKILLVEDDARLARVIELELVHEGYDVIKAEDGGRAVAAFAEETFDLVLLDVMLPVLSGFEVLRRIKAHSGQTPVIMLTARDAVPDRVQGLDAGADDYITKPFAMEELLARIRAVFRRKGSGAPLSCGPLRLDVKRHEVSVGQTPVELTKREFDLLLFLLENKDMVLSRNVLLDKVWGYQFDGGANTVDVYVRYLRAKLEEPFGCKLIHTVRGVGYVIRDE